MSSDKALKGWAQNVIAPSHVHLQAFRARKLTFITTLFIVGLAIEARLHGRPDLETSPVCY